MITSTLAGKNVVIIGGTAGIGLATAVSASQRGAKVWAAGRTQAHIDTATQTAAGAFEIVQADTHDAASMEAIFKDVGEIDHLVSAAIGGERTLKPFLEQTEDQFKAAYDKLWGYAKVVRTGAPYMADGGAITLVSGSPARKVSPSTSALTCVGASVEAMVRCLAVEMAPIRVNVVSPGTISTAMFDWMGEGKEETLAKMTQGHLIKRAGSSDEVAAGLIFVMENGYVTGTTVDVDGGRLLS
jgi:NAD(P)-dependent dehydrogenase (short-subunit alcohol dehydrogenase family)